MQKPKRAVICLSGGMDSTSLLLRLLAEGRRVFGLSFNYGQKHLIELSRLQKNFDYLREHDLHVDSQTMDLTKLGSLFHSALTDDDWQIPTGHYEQENMKQTVVPNRNAIFSSIAYGYALSIAKEQDAEMPMSIFVWASIAATTRFILTAGRNFMRRSSKHLQLATGSQRKSVFIYPTCIQIKLAFCRTLTSRSRNSDSILTRSFAIRAPVICRTKKVNRMA
jgi:7-cyano-7-deazaguanine synthase in queuosine biosynthesis